MPWRRLEHEKRLVAQSHSHLFRGCGNFVKEFFAGRKCPAKSIDDFVAHFKAALADGGPYHRQKILRP